MSFIEEILKRFGNFLGSIIESFLLSFVLMLVVIVKLPSLISDWRRKRRRMNQGKGLAELMASPREVGKKIK